jgi:hypothetical protein
VLVELLSFAISGFCSAVVSLTSKCVYPVTCDRMAYMYNYTITSYKVSVKYMSNAILLCVKWKMEWNGIVQACYVQYCTDDRTFDIM